MVSSSGPGRPRQCDTVGLQDVEGWGEAGQGLFLFELSDGVYRRVPLPPRSPPPWLLDFRLVHPAVSFVGSHRLKKWQSLGRSLASLIPRDRGGVKLRVEPDAGYAAFCVKKAGCSLRLVSEIENGMDPELKPGSTLAFQVVLGRPAPTSYLTLMKGVKIKWDRTAEWQALGLVIRIPGRGGEPDAYLTRQDASVLVEDKIWLGEVHVYPHLGIQKLFYVDQLLAPELVEPLLHE